MQDEYAAIQRCVYACVCVCERVRVYVFVYHLPQTFLGNADIIDDADIIELRYREREQGRFEMLCACMPTLEWYFRCHA